MSEQNTPPQPQPGKKFTSGYIHLSALERETIHDLCMGLIQGAKPHPDFFAVMSPVITCDSDGWFALNQILLKTLNNQ